MDKDETEIVTKGSEILGISMEEAKEEYLLSPSNFKHIVNKERKKLNGLFST